jgi:DNA-binding IclR family transcriptional regulator
MKAGEMMAISGTGTPGKSVTERVFAVLMAFDITHRRMTLSQISRPSGLPVATTFRLLNSLEGIVAVERNTAGLYSIGATIWELGILAPTHDVIGLGTLPLLTRLTTDSGMVVRVFVFSGQSTLHVQEVARQGPNAPAGGPGLTLSLVDSAAGRVLLAGLSPADRSAIPLTRTHFDRLEENLALIRTQGWARMAQANGGVEYAVAVPAEGRPPMALSVSTPTKAVVHTDADSGPAAPAPSLIRELRHVAHGLATILSGSGNLEARTRA